MIESQVQEEEDSRTLDNPFYLLIDIEKGHTT